MHRERVAAALSHATPDRCPWQATFTPEFAERLRADLRLDEAAGAHNPHGGGNPYDLEMALDQDCSSHRWAGRTPTTGEGDEYVDEWGVGLAVGALQDAVRRGSLHRAEWPSPGRRRRRWPLPAARPGPAGALRRRRNGSSPSTATSTGSSGPPSRPIFETAWALRGLEQLMIDFIEDPDLADAILEIPYRYHLAAAETLAAHGRRHDLARRRRGPAARHAHLAPPLAALPQASYGEHHRARQGHQPGREGRLPHRWLRLRHHPRADRDRDRRAQPGPAAPRWTPLG